MINLGLFLISRCSLSVPLLDHLIAYLNLLKVIERLEKYTEEKGQTKTIAVERLLTKSLDVEENKKN